MSSLNTARTLYLCYFGLREPLVQTQVLPYLKQLAAAGIRVSLLTFEPHLRSAWTKQELAAHPVWLAKLEKPGNGGMDGLKRCEDQLLEDARFLAALSRSEGDTNGEVHPKAFAFLSELRRCG